MLSNAACPGGEEAVLKTVGLKGLASSNLVCCVIEISLAARQHSNRVCGLIPGGSTPPSLFGWQGHI